MVRLGFIQITVESQPLTTVPQGTKPNKHSNTWARDFNKVKGFQTRCSIPLNFIFIQSFIQQNIYQEPEISNINRAMLSYLGWGHQSLSKQRELAEIIPFHNKLTEDQNAQLGISSSSWKMPWNGRLQKGRSDFAFTQEEKMPPSTPLPFHGLSLSFPLLALFRLFLVFFLLPQTGRNTTQGHIS